jgi:predicted SAM-dependent methyltransferase
MKNRLKNLLKKIWYRVRFMGKKHDKLHLGSGKVVIPGWCNIDFDTQFPGVDHLDLRKPLPFANNSIELIFSEHLIEHLPKADGLNLLRECYRVLKPGGKLRFGWPDFTKHLNAYLKKDKNYRKKMHKHMGPNLSGTYEEFFSDLLYSWDHRHMYTPKLLKRYFKEAGFKRVKENEFGESKLGFVWDTRDDVDTTYLETKKVA